MNARDAFGKIRRFRGMGRKEVWHRIRERCRIESDRIQFLAGLAPKRDRDLELLPQDHGSIKSYLGAGPSQRFYAAATAAQRERTIGFVTHHFPEWMKSAAEEADRLCRHYIDLFDRRSLFLGPEIDWNRDPINGYEWPVKFWASYGPHSMRGSDPKTIHELNRHQHLPRIAKAYFLTGDELYAREAVAQLESWIEQCQVGFGIQWQSSLEIAIRAISWIWTIFFLTPSRAFDERVARRAIRSLLLQLDHVYRYPSLYTSPNTHLIGEAAALFIGGIVFADIPRAAEWRRFGSNVLVGEMSKQVGTDGVYREASVYYHCYAADFYLQTLALGRANRFEFPGWMWQRLAQMLEFVLYVSRPDGSMPLIGDDDGGRALALCRRDYSFYRDGLALGTVLFGRSDFKSAAHSFAEETMWLLGSNSFDVFNQLDEQPQKDLHRFYADSGCFIQRSDAGPDASHVVFDCGGLGMLSGGHGHADALSFTLFSKGTEVLIDPGTAIYNGASQWRNYFRSTHAHNTVLVDGLDQSEPAGSFSWKNKATSRLIACRTLPGMDYIEGEHDGYLRLRQGVIHRRRLLFVRPSYWIVLDELSGRGEHVFDFLYHFAPGAELFVLDEERRGDVDCRVRCGPAVLQIYMHASAPLQAKICCGDLDPIRGWFSSGYGQRQPSPVLTAAMRSSAPSSMLTFVAPGADSSVSRRLRVRGNNALAASFNHGEWEDICVLSPDADGARLDDYHLRGEVFWIRTKQGQLKQLIGINVWSFSIHDETIFEHYAPMPYIVVHFWENGIVIERGENEGKLYVRDMRYRQFQRQ